MLWGIYSAIYGEVNVSVEKCVEIKGDYVEKEQIWFISVTLKSWSGRKLLDPTTYVTFRNFGTLSSGNRFLSNNAQKKEDYPVIPVTEGRGEIRNMFMDVISGAPLMTPSLLFTSSIPGRPSFHIKDITDIKHYAFCAYCFT